MPNFVPYSPSVTRSFFDRKRVPNVPGVYVVTTGRRVLYVGKATVSIRERHSSKFYDSASPSDRGLVALADRSHNPKIHCIPLPFGKLWIGSVEARLIKSLKPTYNTTTHRISPIVSALEFPLILLASIWQAFVWGGGATVISLVIYRYFFG